MSVKDELPMDEAQSEEEKREEKQENYMALGMCLGVAAGCIGMCILAMFGHILWGIPCIGVGLIGGMLIGMAIPKKK